MRAQLRITSTQLGMVGYLDVWFIRGFLCHPGLSKPCPVEAVLECWTLCLGSPIVTTALRYMIGLSTPMNVPVSNSA